MTLKSFRYLIESRIVFFKPDSHLLGAIWGYVSCADQNFMTRNDCGEISAINFVGFKLGQSGVTKILSHYYFYAPVFL